MKFIIASDIHGSAYYCEKLLEQYKKIKPERVVLLGDILYHGPRNDLPRDYNPKRVIELLNEIKEDILCVRGNCDTEVDQMVLEFPIMADYAVIFDGQKTIYCTHGHKYNLENLPPINSGDILLHGHTHIKADETVNGIRYINPGSVSIPKDGSNSFIVYENEEFCFKTIE